MSRLLFWIYSTICRGFVNLRLSKIVVSKAFLSAHQRPWGKAYDRSCSILKAVSDAVERLNFNETHLEDQVAALQFLQALRYVDKNLTAVMGFSFGGIQTMLAVEYGPGYRVAVNCSVAAETWRRSSFLRERLLTTATSKAKMLVFFCRQKTSIT